MVTIWCSGQVTPDLSNLVNGRPVAGARFVVWAWEFTDKQGEEAGHIHMVSEWNRGLRMKSRFMGYKFQWPHTDTFSVMCVHGGTQVGVRTRISSLCQLWRGSKAHAAPQQ